MFDFKREAQDTYITLRTLGKGSFGTTYLVKKEGDSENTYVIKELKLTPTKIPELMQEIGALRKIAKHGCKKNLLCFRDYFVNFDKGTFNIITDAFQNATTLKEFIKGVKSRKELLDVYDLLKIMNGMMEALAYLHKIGIAHSDIKPDNILINNNLEIQIIDFGLACLKRCRPSGTVLFASPEMLRMIGGKREVSLDTLKAADVFSMGIVFYLLANLEFPFSLKRSPYADEEVQQLQESSFVDESVLENTISEVNHMFPVANPSDIYGLDAFYSNMGKYIFSSYGQNQTTVVRQLNELIEDMLTIQTKARHARPSAKRVLARLRRIINKTEAGLNPLNLSSLPLSDDEPSPNVPPLTPF